MFKFTGKLLKRNSEYSIQHALSMIEHSSCSCESKSTVIIYRVSGRLLTDSLRNKLTYGRFICSLYMITILMCI